ncbi:hypothetical protein KR067_004491 [Drosophila pandora]|nr:hypothetical protein KR067_004491 [Drosophila pandora]
MIKYTMMSFCLMAALGALLLEVHGGPTGVPASQTELQTQSQRQNGTGNSTIKLSSEEPLNETPIQIQETSFVSFTFGAASVKNVVTNGQPKCGLEDEVKKVQECIQDVMNEYRSHFVTEYYNKFFCEKLPEEIAHCEEMFNKYKPCLTEDQKNFLVTIIKIEKKTQTKVCSIEQQYEEHEKTRKF